MSVLFGIRFDFRNPAFAGTTPAERYAAALDMAEWADDLGCVSIAVSEHHGSPDGYLPSPLPMLAAMAARTTNVRFMVAALIAPFHDPLRLAEDLIVLDHLSAGRVDVVVAGGYVREEFAMFGVPMSERGARVTETVATLKAAFTGEPFEFRGRTVHVTPAPYRPGGPASSSAAAASRPPGARPASPTASSRRCPRCGTSTATRSRSSAVPTPAPAPSARTGSWRSPRTPTRDGADGPVLPPRDERLRRVAGAGRRRLAVPLRRRHRPAARDRPVRAC